MANTSTITSARSTLHRLKQDASLPRPKRRRIANASELLDRIEDALADGRLDLVEDREDVATADGPTIDQRSLAALFEIMFPEEFRETTPPQPTHTWPGQPDRIATYRRRVTKGQSLWHQSDFQPNAPITEQE